MEDIENSSSRRSQRIPHPNSLVQLGGCLKRMAVERKRSVRGTLCECCSHLILILILVFGYLLSKVEDMPEEKYTTLSLGIPPTALTESENFGQGALDFYYEIMNGPLIIPNLDQYVAIGDAFQSVAGPFTRILQSTGFGDSFTNLLYRGSLHFSPNSGVTRDLINFMNNTYSSFNDFDVIVHDSEKAGVDYILDNLDDTALALISILQVTPEKVNYKIRQNYTTLPNTNDVLDIPAIGINTAYQQYFFSGFLSLQKAVDEWVYDYLQVAQNGTIYPEQCTGSPPQAVFAPYPTFAYNQNPFYNAVGFLLGLVMVMSTLYPMSKLTKSIVEEKETKMRELMMIMGLPAWVHKLSWFLMSFILFFWIAISTLFVTSASFLTKSNPAILFIYFFLFCMSEITFAFLISVFFSNAKLAAIAGPVILFGSILPRYIFYSSTNNEVVINKVLACFLSPTAFAFGADIIADYEYANVGVQVGNLFNNRFNFGTVLIMLFVDFYIYAFLAWYLDQVLPHENGTPKHPLFIFDFRYWCSCFCQDNNDDHEFATGGPLDFNTMPEFHDSVHHPTIEPITEENIPLAKIRIKKLGKQYPDGKVAVRNFNLSLLKGQITCLLGHNGAGKTTALSMLTGLIQATTGDVSIFGHSLRRELRSIRRITGLCPQLNVLFPLLTVQEHLSFFGCIKGLTGHYLRDAIDDVLLDVGLTEKRHALSQSLSGGMKRKLCLAMALIGDPKFILLDEPTSGMDPYSRRSTWELLQRSKENRVILLTTHFMDEADTLADRIAIMSEGTLLCAGSSLFLKSKFGVGFLLSLSKVVPDAPVPPMTEAIQSIVTNAEVHSSVAGEVIFKLPLGTSPLFGRLFQMLQENAASLHIGSYGISMTTLEQVFIMLAHHKPVEAIDPIEEEAPLLPEYRFASMISNLFTSCMGFFQNYRHSVIPHQLQSPDSAPHQNPEYELVKTAPTAATETNLADATNPSVKVPPELIEHTRQPVLVGSDPSILMPVNANAESNIVVSSTTNTGQQVPLGSGKLLDSGTGGVANVTVFIQLYELYYKRIVVLKRDLKGFFFQILVPAILIVLIMLILTVQLNISGHTLILNGNIFSRYASVKPEFIVAGSNIETNAMVYSIDIFSNRRKFKVQTPEGDVTNSSALSDYLLNMNYFEDKRQGAYVMDDEVQVIVNIDWDWVKRFLGNFPISGTVLRSGVQAAGFMGTTYNFTLPLDTIFTGQTDLSFPETTIVFGGNGIEILNFGSFLTNNTNLLGSTTTSQLASVLFSGSTIVFGDNGDQLNQLLDLFPQLTNVTDQFRDLNVTEDFFIRIIDAGLNGAIADALLLELPSSIDLPVVNITIPGFELSELDAMVFLNVTRVGIIVDVTLLSRSAPSSLLSAFNFQNIILWEDISSRDLLPLLPSGVLHQTIGIPNMYTIMHNTTSPHGLAALQGQLIEANFQMCMNPTEPVPGASNGSSTPSSDYQSTQYLVKNHPLPITPEQTLFIQLILSLLASIFILVPLCYIPASFVAFLVKERISKSKHLQLVSGVSPYLYWVAAYMWDLSLFIFLSLFIIACLYMFGQDVARVFIGNAQQTLGVLCLLLVYGASSIPLAYLYSFAFSNFSTAQIAIMVINFMTGFVLVLAYYVMISVPYTQDAAKKLVHIFRFFPAYNVGEGLINISTNYFEQTILEAGSSIWSWEIIGRDLVFMFVEAIGYFLMVLLSETSVMRTLDDRILRLRGVEKFYPPPRTTPTDDDVAAEEAKVKRLLAHLSQQTSMVAATNDTNGDFEGVNQLDEATDHAHRVVLLLDNLIKTYPSLDVRAKPKYAVRGISLACYDNERFGLLGINGAGKTTTLSVLTSEIEATAGQVYIGGRPLSDSHTMTMLGYCPQVDPLLELMNAYETLWFYGRIRGIDSSILSQRIESLITQTGLTPHARRPSGTYSGGNKRKLSLAVALIGDPKVLLLDEPSTGMDPEARRQMWNVIQQVSDNRTVILVSHSMEEIEALCTRVGVMVSGRMQCLGAIQHLKGKFGTGYQIEVRCHVPRVKDCLRLCHNFLCPDLALPIEGDLVIPANNVYEVEEEHGGYFRLRVHGSIDLALTFDSLEKNKASMEIYDYNVSQCSLEQVFIRFAREQEEEIGRPDRHHHHHHPPHHDNTNQINTDVNQSTNTNNMSSTIAADRNSTNEEVFDGGNNSRQPPSFEEKQQNPEDDNAMNL